MSAPAQALAGVRRAGACSVIPHFKGGAEPDARQAPQQAAWPLNQAAQCSMQAFTFGKRCRADAMTA